MNVNDPHISGDDDASSTTIFVVRNLCTEWDSSGPKYLHLFIQFFYWHVAECFFYS